MTEEIPAKDRVAIIGIGQTKFGEQWDRSIRRISLTAATACIADAGVSGDDIDGLYVSNTSTSSFIQQEHQAAMAADSGGLLPIASTEVKPPVPVVASLFVMRIWPSNPKNTR